MNKQNDASGSTRGKKARIAATITISVILLLTIAFSVLCGIYFVREKTVLALSDLQRELLSLRFEPIDYTPVTDSLKREISAAKPLNIVTYYGDENGIDELWSQIPDDIKEISVVMLIKGNVFAPGGDPDSLIRLSDKCDSSSIPYAIQLVNGETHCEWLMPLKWIENEFCARSCFYGVSTAELYNGEEWRGQMDGDLAWYVNDAIRLMAKHGEFMFFTDTNIFGDNGTFSDWIEENEYLYSTMKDCSEHVFMQNKESYGDPSSYSVMKGLYMAGFIGGWGVATDWWHWQVDGKKALFNEGRNNIDSEWERIYYYPENMQVMSLAMVAANGGFCFKNEAEFYSVAVGGRQTATFRFATIPFLRSVLSGDFYIPSREELLQNEKFAIVGAENYKAVNYDLKESNLYPCTPDYNIIPLLPANLHAEEKRLFDDNSVALLYEKPDKKNTAAYLNTFGYGNTYLTKSGDGWLYLNNSENERKFKTAVATALDYDNAETVSIGATEHTYVYFRQSADNVYFQINNFRLDKYDMVSALDGSETPQDALFEWIAVDPATNDVKADRSELRLTSISVKTPTKPRIEWLTYPSSDGDHHFAFTFNESYKNGVYLIEIRHNGFVSFNLLTNTGTKNRQADKPAVSNKAMPSYDADYEKIARLLDEKKAVADSPEKYSETSFAAFRREYSLLRYALSSHTVPEKRIDEACEFISYVPLVDVSAAAEKLRQVLSDGELPVKGAAYDSLLRAVLSPTKHYNYKEQSLKTYFWTQRKKYGLSLYKAKTNEIAKYINF